MQLRPYQIDIVNDVREAFRSHRRVVMRLATGGGKTPTGAHIVQQMVNKGKKILWLAHKEFLISQASEKLRNFGVRHGILASGRFPDPRHNVLVCSLGVLRNRRDSTFEPDAIVVDEAHHAVSPTWEKLLSSYGCYQLLLTATPERPDGLGMDTMADTIVEGINESELMAWNRTHPGEGLCPYRIVTAESFVHVDGVKKNGLDFSPGELGKFMESNAVLGNIVEEVKQKGVGRKFLSFCPTVKFSEQVAQEYRGHGMRVVHLDGTSKEIRKTLADYDRGELDGITSVNLFLEGLDIKRVGLIQWLRKSESDIVIRQGNGRGWRPDTDDVIFMDHVGNFGHWEGSQWIDKHGLPDATREWSLDGRKKAYREKPMSIWSCRRCYSANSAAYTICKNCGEAKEVKKRKDIEVDTSVSMAELDLEAIKMQTKQDQAAARGVDALRALGYSEGRASHIEAARREKAFKRASVREVATARGDFQALREYMQWKPKQLDSYLAGSSE